MKSKLSCQDLLNRVRSLMKTRRDNDMIDCIGAVYANNKTGLLWPIKLGVVCDKNNDVTGCRDVMYAKNDIELSWPIKPSVVYDENQTRQWRDRSYSCGLHRKQYWIVVTNQIKC